MAVKSEHNPGNRGFGAFKRDWANNVRGLFGNENVLQAYMAATVMAPVMITIMADEHHFNTAYQDLSEPAITLQEGTEADGQVFVSGEYAVLRQNNEFMVFTHDRGDRYQYIPAADEAAEIAASLSGEYNVMAAVQDAEATYGHELSVSANYTARDFIEYSNVFEADERIYIRLESPEDANERIINTADEFTSMAAHWQTVHDHIADGGYTALATDEEIVTFSDLSLQNHGTSIGGLIGRGALGAVSGFGGLFILAAMGAGLSSTRRGVSSMRQTRRNRRHSIESHDTGHPGPL